MWRGGEKESYTTQQDSRGRFVGGGDGTGRLTEETSGMEAVERRGRHRRGLLFIRGFGACAQGLMTCSVRTLRDSSAYAQRVLLVTAVEDPKGGPA